MPLRDTPLDNFLCATCEHRARDHTAFIGPCAECWRKLVDPLCPRFRLRDEDREEVAALKL